MLGMLILSLIAGLAGLDGNAILKKVEETLTAPKDAVAEVRMNLIESSKSEKRRTVKMWNKGKDKRLIKFLSPEDVKGVGFLSLSEDEMYLYMPAFHKIRRIASHVKNESFMGTDFSYEDIGTSKYSDDFIPKLKKETETEYILNLNKKEESDLKYSKLMMFVNKSNFVPDSIQFFDSKGKLLKVMRNLMVKKIDGYWTTTKIEMENVQTDHKTLMELKDVKHDVGLEDKLFTKRYLKRAR